MIRIGVVDHGAGNLVSITQGLERAGAHPVLVDRPEAMEGLNGVVLPGVGATASVMEGVRRAGLGEALRRLSVPMLGICVGMQILFDRSEEDGAECLGLIPGTVARLPKAPRLPHIGWNDVQPVRSDPLLAGLGDRPTFYFVHSYAPRPADPDTVLAVSSYGECFCAAVRAGSVTGVQFHPERSGRAGLALLANFVAECRRDAA